MKSNAAGMRLPALVMTPSYASTWGWSMPSASMRKPGSAWEPPIRATRARLSDTKGGTIRHRSHTERGDSGQTTVNFWMVVRKTRETHAETSLDVLVHFQEADAGRARANL